MQEIHRIQKSDFTDFLLPLTHIPQAPDTLYYEGVLPSNRDMRVLSVVGSRKHTRYGKDICKQLIASLRGHPIIIVSGLALGIDGIAHEAAMEAGLTTIAIPGSGISHANLYPSLHKNMAKKIIECGGALISEFEPTFKATPYSFPQRNRIMAGLSDAILVIEAEEKSGTLITARLGLEYNKDILTVPGNIDSSASRGTNWLIRQGATPICSPADLLEALGLQASEGEAGATQSSLFTDFSDDEKCIYELLGESKSKDTLIRESKLPPARALIALTSLELKDAVKEELSVYKKVYRI